MSDSDLTIAMTFASSHQAQMAKLVLDDHQIPCSVVGGQLSDALPFRGSVISKVDLWVRNADADKAVSILQQLESEIAGRHRDPWAPTPMGWLCDHCEEANEPNFDTCWSCSAERPQKPRPVSLIEEQPPQFEARGNSGVVISTNDSPYRAPQSDFVAVRPNPEHSDRVFRAAIIGLVFLPVSVYALALALHRISTGAATPRDWLAFWISLTTCSVFSVLALLITHRL